MSVQKRVLLCLLVASTCLLASCGRSGTGANADSPAERQLTTGGELSGGTFDTTDAASRQQLARVIEKARHVDVHEIDQELGRIRQDMIIDRYLQSLYQNTVDEAAIENHYRDNAEDYQSRRVKLAHVLLRIPTNASVEEQQVVATRAQEVVAMLRAGEAFSDVARAYSEDERSARQGGEIGWVSEGGIDAQVMQAALEMQINEVSSPLPTRYGIHVITKLTDTQNMQRPLKEVHAAIRQTLRAKAKDEALQRLAAVE